MPVETDVRAGRAPAFLGAAPRPDRRLAFFREFLRHPEEIGSVVPSSRFLERRLVEIANIARARLVIELGPGTGGTTRAILRALSGDAHLLAIEINPRFALLLGANPDPRLIVQTGNAAELIEALRLHGLPRPDAVISGIPFSTMPSVDGRRILQAIWQTLAPGGRFVAYQFRSRVAALGADILGRPAIAVELRNVPPVRVYCWRKAADGVRDEAAR